MKKEIIKTDNYLLVVNDSEIKEGDYCYLLPTSLFNSGIGKVNKNVIEDNGKNGMVFKKIIAHLPINDSADLKGVPLLPPLEDDVEKLDEDLFDKGSDNVLHPQYQMRTFFNMGYNKAKEKYKFTEDDLWVVFNYGRSNMHEETFESLLKRVSQPKTPTHFEFEVVWHNTYGSETQQYDAQELKIKTTTNSQGQQVACGKYLY